MTVVKFPTNGPDTTGEETLGSTCYVLKRYWRNGAAPLKVLTCKDPKPMLDMITYSM